MTEPHGNALILIVEDDAEISLILSRYLEADGCRTVAARDGETALALVRQMRPDLMLLDLNLPRRDGFSVLAALRQESALPVIVVSALGEDADKLAALRIGADDYVTKPFNPREVVARVAAVLRRAAPAPRAVLRAARLVLEPEARRAQVGAQALALTEAEFRLLEFLLRRPGRAVSRAELLDACLPESEALERTVDSHISHLRRKLDAAQAGVALTALRGFGYRLDAEGAA